MNTPMPASTQIAIPEHVHLEGPRLLLRRIQLSDADETYCCWLNDPVVMRYLESRFTTHTPHSLREYIAKVQADPMSLFLAITLKPALQRIGSIKLGPIHPVHRSADIGLLIGDRLCWGKGYASEAISLLTQFAFQNLNLHKLTAGFYAPNQASGRAFQNAGFKIEGVRLSQYLCDHQYVDAVLLGCVNPAHPIQ